MIARAYTPHLLMIEDDAKIADMLGNYLRGSGYTVTHCTDGAQGLQTAQDGAFDLVLLDVMLPSMDGIEVCKELRKTSNVPIIMVTARVQEVDRLLGLEIGADDYVCKPFSPRELVARVKAQLRRSQLSAKPASVLSSAVAVSTIHSLSSGIAAPAQGLALHPDEQRISMNGKTVPLTAVEYRIAKLLMGKPSCIFSRNKLLDAIHDDWRDSSDRVIDTHIKNIRKKFDAAGAEGEWIASVYGAGYRFEVS